MSLARTLFNISLVFSLFAANPALARDISLAWDPSTSTGVVGYKVYYRSDSAALPFAGVDSSTGASPIYSGNVTKFTVKDLEDDHVHYFAVTAVDEEGDESVFSNIVDSSWRPALQYPTDNQAEMPLEFDFIWRAFAAEPGTTYTLYYGVDPSLAMASGSLGRSGEVPPAKGLAIAVPFALALLCLVALGQRGRRSMPMIPATASLLLLALVTGCGPKLLSDSVRVAGEEEVNAIHGIRGSTIRISNWRPNTKYYWKVVANSGTAEFVSGTYSFTTGR